MIQAYYQLALTFKLPPPFYYWCFATWFVDFYLIYLHALLLQWLAGISQTLPFALSLLGFPAWFYPAFSEAKEALLINQWEQHMFTVYRKTIPQHPSPLVMPQNSVFLINHGIPVAFPFPQKYSEFFFIFDIICKMPIVLPSQWVQNLKQHGDSWKWLKQLHSPLACSSLLLERGRVVPTDFSVLFCEDWWRLSSRTKSAALFITCP